MSFSKQVGETQTETNDGTQSDKPNFETETIDACEFKRAFNDYKSEFDNYEKTTDAHKVCAVFKINEKDQLQYTLDNCPWIPEVKSTLEMKIHKELVLGH